ncbi:hypothetical protein QFZ78_004268 [Paenibacillus sp. V4I5]|nr:hypothetical protein [Paenibacillus sp. V4I5]MDQ0918008.1 hypothetical protein [Paenibacillus sp. V4I5]
MSDYPIYVYKGLLDEQFPFKIEVRTAIIILVISIERSRSTLA